MVTDPVCKMTIDENKAAAKSEYKGRRTISARLAVNRSSTRTHPRT
jgi:hypothetical protein